MSQGCVKCGAAGSYVMHPLKRVACADCYRAWIRDESCSVEAVEAAVGRFHVNATGSYSEHCARFDAELLKRTTEWVKA